jgi:hypothetical protein
LRQAAVQSKSLIRSTVTSAGGKATTSRGKRSAENASFRIPATLKALGDPLTYSQRVNSEVASIEASHAYCWRLLEKNVY